MQGYKDPFNRGYYPWGKENKPLLAFYQKLGKLRQSLPCLQDGEIRFLSATLGCVAYTRASEKGEILVIANRNEQEISYNLPERWFNKTELLHGNPVTSFVRVPATGCVILKF